ITCPCYWVSPWGSILIGASAGIVCMLAVDLMEHLRIDDPVGAWPVHGACGVYGTLCLGLFATGEYGAPTPLGADTSAVVKGLFYGGGWNQLKAQVIGNVAIGGSVFILALIMMYAIKATGTLRISKAGEIEGLDNHE